MRYLQLVEQQWRKQDYNQHNEEDLYRFCHEGMCGKNHELPGLDIKKEVQGKPRRREANVKSLYQVILIRLF
jgi:hypothetical protein